MRKFFLSLIFLPLFSILYAQDPDEITVDSLLVNVDLSGLNTEILYDRVVPLSNLKIFNDSINIADRHYFEQALHELYKSSHETKFAFFKDVRDLFSPDSLQNVVDLGIINASFQSLNYNSTNESLGGLQIVNNLFTVNSNGNPLFKESHVFLAAPLKRNLVGDEVIFKISADLLFQDSEGKEIMELSANFDTNTDYLIISNGVINQSSISVSYEMEGEKIISLTATFADGSSKTTQGIFNLKAALPSNDTLIDNGSIWGNIPWQGFNETQAYIGKLDYRIFYSSGNSQKKLMKPVVIIDGFDPGDRRKIQDSDPHPGLTNQEHRSIEEMMTYRNSSGENVQIIPILRNLGYDVVIVNQPTHWANGFKMDGGADYIERNALTHVKLYQFLNNKLAQNNSDEELVIVGPSMGGQISRFALAYMEKHQIPHNTRLWISIDSPHLGANIPMGVQSLLHLLKDVTGSVDAIDFVDNQLGSAAARQQLIEQYSGATNNHLNQNWLDGRTISQGFSENKGRPIFINYYNNLFNNGLQGSKGYPITLRKIAMVNGSLKEKRLFDNPFPQGETIPDGTPYSDLFANNGIQSLKVKGYANGLGHLLTMESYMMPASGNTHKISFFKKKNIIWNYFDRYITNLNSRGNLDNTPGGWYPAQNEVAHEVINSTPCEWVIGQICINDWDLQSLEHVSSFIPTVSGLGHLYPDFQWNADLNRNLVCSNETPFDTYYGDKKNTQHTSFTEESFNWLLEELEGNPQAPTVYFKGDNLMGPDAICQDDIVTYEFDTCNPLEVQQWQVSNGLEIVTYDDISVTVQNNTSSNTSGWIKAIFSNQVVQKDIWIGKPTAPAYLNGPEVVETGAVVTYSGGVAEGATSYEWWLPYPFEVVNPFNTSSPNWQVYPNAGRNTQVFTGTGENSGYIQLMGVNSCGNGDAEFIYVEHGQGGSGQQQLPVYPYPNTADEAFNLDFTSYPNSSYQIYVYDANSNVIYEGSSENIEKTISTLDIPTGNYFLHIHLDQEVLQYQLIIQH